MKVCNKCELSQTEESFYKYKKKDKQYLYHICKSCCLAKNKELKDYGRDWELKKKYGISLEQYKEECSNELIIVIFVEIKQKQCM